MKAVLLTITLSLFTLLLSNANNNSTISIDADACDVQHNLTTAETSFEIQKVSPNPAINFVQIDFTSNATNIQVEVFDLTGALVHTLQTATQKGYNSETVNIDHLARGIYFIGIRTADSQVMSRFIKR